MNVKGKQDSFPGKVIV